MAIVCGTGLREREIFFSSTPKNSNKIIVQSGVAKIFEILKNAIFAYSRAPGAVLVFRRRRA